jgi:hypothetical protein
LVELPRQSVSRQTDSETTVFTRVDSDVGVRDLGSGLLRGYHEYCVWLLRFRFVGLDSSCFDLSLFLKAPLKFLPGVVSISDVASSQRGVQRRWVDDAWCNVRLARFVGLLHDAWAAVLGASWASLTR